MWLFTNKYRDKIEKEKDEIDTNHLAIATFGRKLQKAMGLTESDLKKAEKADTEWVIGDYVVYVATRPQYGWRNMLEARPKEMPKNHGYTNVSYSTPHPCDFYYKQAGTATEILPLDNIQREILSLV
jgi:hypothetical protein